MSGTETKWKEFWIKQSGHEWDGYAKYSVMTGADVEKYGPPKGYTRTIEYSAYENLQLENAKNWERADKYSDELTKARAENEELMREDYWQDRAKFSERKVKELTDELNKLKLDMIK